MRVRCNASSWIREPRCRVSPQQITKRLKTAATRMTAPAPRSVKPASSAGDGNDAKAVDEVTDEDSDGWAELAEGTGGGAELAADDDSEEGVSDVDFDPEIVEDPRSGIEVTAAVALPFPWSLHALLTQGLCATAHRSDWHASAGLCIEKQQHIVRSSPRPQLSVQALDPDKLPDGEALLGWLLAPVPSDAFMDHIFDDRPLLVSRPGSQRYYAPWFSRAIVDELLRWGTGVRSPAGSCAAIHQMIDVMGVTRSAPTSHMSCIHRLG